MVKPFVYHLRHPDLNMNKVLRLTKMYKKNWRISAILVFLHVMPYDFGVYGQPHLNLGYHIF